MPYPLHHRATLTTDVVVNGNQSCLPCISGQLLLLINVNYDGNNYRG